MVGNGTLHKAETVLQRTVFSFCCVGDKQEQNRGISGTKNYKGKLPQTHPKKK